MKKNYDEKVRKITDVTIYEKETINGLKEIEFKICDSIYKFKSKQIKDTIRERLMISDKIFPCNVELTYKFYDETKKSTK